MSDHLEVLAGGTWVRVQDSYLHDVIADVWRRVVYGHWLMDWYPDFWFEVESC